MEWANIFLFGLLSSVIGAALLLLIQYYVFVKYFNTNNESNEERESTRNCFLPDNLMFDIHAPATDTNGCTVALNLIFQFLFYELRNTGRVRNWLYKKLSVELEQLSKTTTGKLFEKISIVDLKIGNQFPDIRNVRVLTSDVHNLEGNLDNIEVDFKFSYNGNFKLTIDTVLGMFGKNARVSLCVKHLSGNMRLKFTRLPYTYWALSFVGDPVIDLGIECQLPTKQMQSNITTLISNQIKKVIKKRHTLPNYKIRYKPFFHHIDDDFALHDVQIGGKMDVKLIEITRVQVPSPDIVKMYCVLTVSSIPFIMIKKSKIDEAVTVEMDVEIIRAKNQQIGIIFKHEKELIIIDDIIPNTPASKAGVPPGAILHQIESKTVTNLNQVAKIIKNVNKPVLLLKISKRVNGTIVNSNEEHEVEEKNVHQDNEFSYSPKKTGINILKTMKSKLVRTASDFQPKPHENINTTKLVDNELKDLPTYTFWRYHSKYYEIKDVVNINDLTCIDLNERSIYININVIGVNEDESFEQLLGYINIPIAHVVEENQTSLLHQMKHFYLLSPDMPNVVSSAVSSQSGFDPYLCYGDILLSFKKIGCNLNSTSDKNLSKKSENDKEHYFLRAHFSRITFCDFCGKKIWLKDALQCQECGMVCHRKCLEKCTISSKCKVDSEPKIELQLPDSEDFKEDDQPEQDVKRRKSSQFLNLSNALNIKRVNSTSNLTLLPLALNFTGNSKSLPPTPQRSIRKPETHFVVDVILKCLENYAVTNQYSHVEEIIQQMKVMGTLDELIDMAKVYGSNIYGNLDPDSRVKKINHLMNVVHQILEIEPCNVIEKEVSPNYDISKGSLTEDEIGTTEYLNVAMLFLCTGLQNAQNIST